MSKRENDMYRKLTDTEIEILKDRGCTARNWNEVEVADGFDPSRIAWVNFLGKVRLGRFDKEVAFEGGVVFPSGIYHATLSNCEIGDNVFIDNVKQYISNYIIESDVAISDVQSIVCTGSSTFGNNVKVAVLNETGGREIPIYDRLSSHVAYIIALYRHKKEAVNGIVRMIGDYADSIRSDYGRIGKGSRIISCGTIRDVKFGPASYAEGVLELSNGSVNSCEKAPAVIGRGVIAKDFIISDSTDIRDGVLLDKCFVGQGCHLGKQYSAENSVFFANCVGMHGEACSVFGGPYTVTHHKSTLLIAGMFSFSNAGSGSNQSNHLYKLGPIHQGIAERGCKTTSDSYILCPYQVGAFSVIMGRHTNNADTSDMPFSYLIEEHNKTTLVPGINLRSVGTIRDAMKWPRRDKRRGEEMLDLINFNLLSPYTICKMMKARKILSVLKNTSGTTSEFYSYQGAIIKNKSLQRGLRLYSMAINKFLGNSLIKRLEIEKWQSIEQIRRRLKPDFEAGLGEWVDISGLFAPKSEVDRLLDDVVSGKVADLSMVYDRLVEMQRNYYDYEWTWAIDQICRQLRKPIDEIAITDIVDLVKTWRKSVVDLDRELYEDAKKEFALSTKTGFGVDGDDRDKMIDFEQVRGDFENNDFVKNVLLHIEAKSELARELLERIAPLCK